MLVDYNSTVMKGKKVRYITIKAKNVGVCPPDHPGAGGKAWLFVDEITVN
jgi:hexosaminidase